LLAFLTSGTLLRLDGFRTRDVHVTVPPDNRLGRGQTKVNIHRAWLLDDETLEAAFESARRMGLATLTTVGRAIDAAGKKPGLTRLRRVVSAAESRPKESRLDVKLARLLRSGALPESVPQYSLLQYRLDRAWPELLCR
jgi:hypothetical protein